MDPCDKASPLERLSRRSIPWGAAAMAFLRRLRRPGATLTALVVAAFGVVQVLRASSVGGDRAWESGETGWWFFVTLAAAATILSLFVVLGYRQLLRRQGAREKFTIAARKTLDYVLDNTQLSRDDVGVNIWRVQGMYGFRHLVRQASAIQEGRRETPILWTKGKGAIGQCWREKAEVRADVEELHQVLATEDDFCATPWDDRFRFTWREFQQTDRYKAVLAVPLRARRYGRFPVRGVLAIDVLAAGRGTEIFGIEKQHKFGVIIQTCQAVLTGDQEER